ncbi:RNA 2',3'-cyclic phosphodiesterase [uncultured Thermanaerothrix sp.]|uniref:RNA 2',3'-cyclic phosphodiesterase n=1 Tax=uncultured Thermanaerothrix sp. TaxID=1195149 RepID=UPI002605C128|nr:RNA 2',3'-cyclic phosphodiesterase [uncultured Thermanaerothrix sp.]
MKRVRAFIAIEFSTDLQQRLDALVQSLRAAGLGGIRWVPPENIHLTLRFLGEIQPETLQGFITYLPSLAQAFSPFTLHLQGLGVFPGLRHPRVLWVGVKAPESLFNLQHEVENLAHQLGIPPEDRPFTPHITLGRMRPDFGSQDQIVLETQLRNLAQRFNASLYVEEVCLFRSDLLPDGARYTLLLRTPLLGARKRENGLST